jgi:hypothetical protein
MRVDQPRKRRSAQAGVLLLGLSVASEHAIRAQEGVVFDESCAELMTEVVRWADEIVLLPVDASTARVAEDAIERWERCEEYAIAFPRFVVGSGHGRRVKIHIERRLPGDGHCGSFVGDVVTVHRLARVANEILSCPPTDRVLAHELGHVLGLRDVEAPRGCPTFIMSEVVEACPPLQKVGRDECRAVDRKWMTSDERDREASQAAREATDAVASAAPDVP